VAIITETKIFKPSGWDNVNSSFASNTNTNTFNNFINEDENNSGYGQIYLTTGSNAETKLYINFDFSDIPANAQITSITGKAKIYGSGSTAYVTKKEIVGTINRQRVGTSTTFGTSTTPVDLSFGNDVSTGEQLQNLQLLIYFKRGTRSTTSNFYGRFYGASITITYSYDDSSGDESKIYVKQNNQWKQFSKVYKKQNGTWVEQTNLANLFDTNTNYVKMGN